MMTQCMLLLQTKYVGVWFELLGAGKVTNTGSDPMTNTPHRPPLTPRESVAVRPPVPMMFFISGSLLMTDTSISMEGECGGGGGGDFKSPVLACIADT